MGWTFSPYGDFTATLEGDSLNELVVHHADPRVRIADSLVTLWRDGECPPWLTLTGDVLRIRATNRTVIYRLIEHLPDRHVWIAQWPD